MTGKQKSSIRWKSENFHKVLIVIASEIAVNTNAAISEDLPAPRITKEPRKFSSLDSVRVIQKLLRGNVAGGSRKSDRGY